MNNLRAQRDLIDDCIAVAEERDAAYAERETNPERWRAAKQAYADKRRFWREISSLDAPQEVPEGSAVATPENITIEADTPATRAGRD